MLAETSWVPAAACSTLRAISCVAAPCSSTAEATPELTSLILEMVLVIDSMALTWHHYPTSYDLHIGSVNGPRLATIGIYRYPSVASAKASERGTRHGRRNALVIRPQAIEYIVRDGEGARQRVVISADDAAKIRASGLLDERGRILTVWNDNVQ